MGIMVSILLSYVGAVELAFMVRDVTHQVCLHNQRLTEEPVHDLDGLKQIQTNLRRSINEAKLAEISDEEQVMQDGVVYENGYRVVESSVRDQLAANRWSQRRKELKDSDNDGTNEQTNNERPSSELPKIQFDEYDRPQGDYTEEQLAAMDGVKFRPIVRDDGSGRRKAFKKRQQSSSSTSSGEPSMRSSREDELKMFTSLEEEELGIKETSPIQYSSDHHSSNKHKKHHRRQKRSPTRHLGDGSDDECESPWGDVHPKHLHDKDLWQRERASSIVEENEDDPHESATSHNKKSPKISSLASGADRCYSPVGNKNPRTMSFEDATEPQHEMVIKAMKRQTSKNDVPNASRGVDHKGNRKGKNVSTAGVADADEDNDDCSDDATPSPDPTPMNDAPQIASKPDSAPPPACVDLDISGRSSPSQSSLDEAKITQFISYIEQFDDLDRTDPEQVQFEDYPDTSRRIRHTSYNTSAVDRGLDEGVIVNTYEKQLLERVNSQEEQLKSIQAQIERINSSLTPVTRDILSVDNVSTHTSSSSSNTFIKHESLIETTITTNDIASHQPKQGVDTPQSKHVENVAVQTFAETTPRKFITIENISLVGHGDESVHVPDSASSDSAVKIEFDARPTIKRMTSLGNHNPIPLIHQESYESAGSSSFYGRQESLLSGVSTNLENENELEYIHGRDDWHDIQSRSNIHAAIDSDNYHHFRRFSEVDDTLEYIRGRDDWKLRQAEKESSVRIIEMDDSFSLTIRDQIDSDEYHHARRVSECLDLAYGTRSVRFVTPGSGRTGRSGSPFKTLRSDMDRNEFLDRFYKGADEFERSVSESRDIAEVRMISSERLGWSKSGGRPKSRSLTPAPIHIFIEDTSIEDDVVETWEEVDHAELVVGSPSATNSNSSSGWDLGQSYDLDETAINAIMAQENEHGAFQHQNTIADDIEADEEVAGILSSSNFECLEINKESSSERTPEASEEEDKFGGSTSSLKKSKTTRNLLDAERLSVDLSSNEPALKAIAAKSEEINAAREKKGAVVSSFLEQERMSNDGVATLKQTIDANPEKIPVPDAPTQIIKPVEIKPMSTKTKAPTTPKRTTVPQENMDDLMLETSMGPWFHK